MQKYVDESIEKEGKRPLIPDLEFQWTSSFSRRTGTFFTFYTLAFEFLMVYTCRMIAEGNIAASQLDSVATPADYENAAKGALARVKAAAGEAGVLLSILTWPNLKGSPHTFMRTCSPYVNRCRTSGRQRCWKYSVCAGQTLSFLEGLEGFFSSNRSPVQGDIFAKYAQKM